MNQDDKFLDEVKKMFKIKECQHKWVPSIQGGFKCANCGMKINEKK